jgi:hypothetical protein
MSRGNILCHRMVFPILRRHMPLGSRPFKRKGPTLCRYFKHATILSFKHYTLPVSSENVSSNSIGFYRQPAQQYIHNFQSLFDDGVTGFTPPPPPSSYSAPPLMREPFYWLIPPRDPPMMGNAESDRNIHLPVDSNNYYSASYPMETPPVAQQPPDQLKWQLNRVTQCFRTYNLNEISKREFLDNAKSLFVEGRMWCNSYPMKFHHDYKQPLRELADWLSMYFPDRFLKGEFEDILSLEDLEFMG